MNELRIFAKSSLEILHATGTRFKLLSLTNKPSCPMLSDTSATALFEKEIGHIFNTSNPGWKCSLIQIENELDNRVLFGIYEFTTSVTGIRF